MAKVIFDDPKMEELHRNARPIPGAMDWIKKHGDEYAGRWVAIGPNGLVAAADTFPELDSQLESFEGVLIAHLF